MSPGNRAISKMIAVKLGEIEKEKTMSHPYREPGTTSPEQSKIIVNCVPHVIHEWKAAGTEYRATAEVLKMLGEVFRENRIYIYQLFFEVEQKTKDMLGQEKWDIVQETIPTTLSSLLASFFQAKNPLIEIRKKSDKYFIPSRHNIEFVGLKKS